MVDFTIPGAADLGAAINPNNIPTIPGLDSSGPASALSSITSSVSGAISSVGSLFNNSTKTKLPIPNALLSYASYDYILGIASLTDEQLADPDNTYMKGIQLPLICKSANSDPKNRIKTAFGQFDFFIDKLEIKSTIGLEQGHNTNLLGFNCTVVEPYSMGMFFIAVQQAAWDAGHDNFIRAPFLLTIDFKGNTETGRLETVPNSSRKIPFNFIDCSMTVTEKGAVYSLTCVPVNSQAHSSDVGQVKTDVSIKGTTVQEVLQTGEKSLQAVINKRLQQLKKDKLVPVPDEILILFPNEVASAQTTNSKDNTETKSSATTKPATIDSISAQIGVTRSAKNQTLVQEDSACNALGKALVGASDGKKGDTSVGKDNQIYDANKKVYVRGNNTIDPKQGDYRFTQDTSIVTAINQVLLNSDYVKNTLSKDNIDAKGMRNWWRVDTQVYRISTDANYKATGDKPRLIVYRVIPYQVHSSVITPPNTKAPGFEELKKEAVKEYNYIYTGKNVDIMSFDIEFKTGFKAVAMASSLAKTQDVKQEGQMSPSDVPQPNFNPIPIGNSPEKKPGALPTSVSYSGTSTGTDRQGGGGIEDGASRAAKMFHDAITMGSEMLQLNLKIIGDPYYIAQSGQGNYTSKQQTSNLNTDGSVNYQSGEVDIVVNFRTPIDINQQTGLYDFGNAKTAPVLQWSGLYKVLNVISTFEHGQFTQQLTGTRRPSQELTQTAKSDQTFNVSGPSQPTTTDNDY
jgi:hypothetical protein